MTTETRFAMDADGVWGVVGPVDQIKPGAILTVTKRSRGTSTVTVATVADEPRDDGTIFAWIEATPPPRASAGRGTSRRRGGSSSLRRSTSTSRRRACVTDGNCSSFGDGGSCGGHDCDGH